MVKASASHWAWFATVTLVAQANPEDRQGVRRLRQQVQADAGLIRRAGTWRQQDAGRLQVQGLLDAERIVALDERAAR